ncbi:MAG: hypothetical protein IPJ68_04910 [Candidatus Moraniibacteriota bacterium]|nr:MAG: hypothetical protein IPJ68_04910 [Candidatus Moranbacteria bacterium]
MENLINWKRVYGNFALLLDAYRRQEFPYQPEHLARVPHHMVDVQALPDWTANDWFYTTHLLRGKVQSHMATARAIELRAKHPELFDPYEAAKFSAAEIDRRLEQVFGTVPPQQHYGEAWRRNSEILIAWGGDILAVYEGLTTEVEVRDRVMNKGDDTLPLRERGFYGFQEKMCALLTINLMQAGFIRRISMSFPVDFHHTRVLIGTGMFKLENGSYNPKSIMAAGDAIGRAYLDRFPGVDPVKFSELLFILSREGCRWANNEPETDWKDPATINRFRRSCAPCPLAFRCDQTVLTRDYYPEGKGSPRRITVVSRPKPPRSFRLG